MADDDPTKRVPEEGTDNLSTVRGLAAGQKVFGRYVLEAVLGQGGMGVVWRARDEELGNLVALKFLPEIVARDDAAVDELKEETRNALRLTHPNIVRIHHFERDESMAAVSMEFVDGITLSKLRLAQPGKVFSVEKLAPLVTQLCAALDYAHCEAKIVHRDLKPANLLVTSEGRLKIADFGIARSLADTHTRLTGRTVGTSGTLLYMSPQQLLGAKPTAADDLYALGATLYELLTSRPPFFTGDIATQVKSMTPPSLAERRSELAMVGEPIPDAWEETVAACLAKDPAQRPQTAGEVARRLGLAGRSTELRPVTRRLDADERGRKNGSSAPPIRSKANALVVSALVALLLCIIACLFWPEIWLAPFAPLLVKPVTAFDETKTKAERGDAKAQFDLGLMYAKGIGVPKDSVVAVRWFREAADQNYARGQVGLGMAYANGDGVPKDSMEAVEWYRKAANQGDVHGQYGLGLMYAKGDGVPKGGAQAVQWYRKAADQGYSKAQYNLAWMYGTGNGVLKDSVEAIKWLRKAADQGDADAQNYLGVMYSTGNGVPKNEIEALAWWNIAASSGNDTAGKNRDMLELRLGNEMSLVAQQRSKEILKEIEATKTR